MKRIQKLWFLISCVLMVLLSSVFAADSASISILSPKDGAVIQGGAAIKLSYTLHLSPDGNHLHIYIDDQRPIIDRDVGGCPCSIDLPSLAIGKHIILIKEARADHSITGVEKGVAFVVK